MTSSAQTLQIVSRELEIRVSGTSSDQIRFCKFKRQLVAALLRYVNLLIQSGEYGMNRQLFGAVLTEKFSRESILSDE